MEIKHKTISIKSKISVKGRVVFTLREANLPLEAEIENSVRYLRDLKVELAGAIERNKQQFINLDLFINRCRKKIIEVQKRINYFIDYFPSVRVSSYDNLTTTVGRTSIANRLAGGSNDCDITYGAIGDTVATPAVSDTTLVNEIYRGSVTSASYSGTQVRVRLFIGSGSGNPGGGTLYDFGWFGDGATGVKDSGVMWNHLSIVENKTSAYSLTVDGYIDLNDA